MRAPRVDWTRVALFGPRGSFLERALAVNPSVTLRTYGNGAADMASASRDGVDVVVCDDGTGGLPPFIPALVIAGGDGQRIRGLLTAASVTHPLMAALEPGQQRATVWTSAAANLDADVLLRVGGVPAVTATETDGRRIVDVYLDLSQPDFAVTPAFPILIANALAWLTASGELAGEVTAGEPFTFSTTLASRTPVRVVGPDGRPRDVQRVGQRFIVADTDAAGEIPDRRERLGAQRHCQPVGRGRIQPLRERRRIPRPVRDHTAGFGQRTGRGRSMDDARGAGPAESRVAAADGGLVVRFAHPFTLMALLVLPWLWWMARQRRLRIGWLRLTWRASTALLLILGASGVAIAMRQMPATAVVALDRSASVPARAQSLALARVNGFTSTMKAGDRLGLVSFGSDAALDVRPGEAVRRVAVRSSVVDSGTDIGGALRLARAVAPADGLRRIVLISDGRDTAGAAEREALITAAAGITIDVVVPADESVLEPVRVTRLLAPEEVSIREPYVVSVEVAGTPASRGTVAVYRDDDVIATRQVVVGVDGSASIDVAERQERARAYTYRAVSRSESPERAPAGAVVLVKGEPTILYVSAAFKALDSILTSAGYRVTSVAPEQVPQTAAALSSFAGVVVDDVPADRLTGAAAEALAAYVEDEGGGLLILGSARALTPDAYAASPLEHIIPVDLRRRSGQRTPTVDLVLVFDKSGSMADLSDGVPKIEIARQAVLRAVDVMPPGDAIGVLAFDSKSETVAALSAVRDAQALRTALRDVLPGGSTSIAPAVTTAIDWLHVAGRPAAARRQILLISDGRTSDDDAARLQELARTGGVELSVVAIGPNANRPLLEALATASGGRAYFPENLRDLPRTVARAAARSSGGGVVQERFVLRGADHPVLTGIDLAALPAMNGYVVGAAKATAAVILASHLDDPILCAWRAGLGRVAVFTGDLASPWSAPLRAWRDDGRLWAQAIRWVGRRDTNRAIHLEVRDAERGPRLEVEFENLDGSAIAPDDVTAIVRQPGGATTQLDLEAFAAGRYGAPFPAADTGSYLVTLSARDRQSGREDRLVRAVYWSADRERQGRGTDVQFLSRLASLTGGRLLRDGESPFDGPDPPDIATRRSGHRPPLSPCS